MPTFSQCVQFHVEDEQVLSRMFAVENETLFTMALLMALFFLAFSIFWICMINWRDRKTAYFGLNLFAWQCTNTWILWRLYAGITRSVLSVFGIHTFLEWSISISMEYYVRGSYPWRKPWRIIGIALVVVYSTMHQFDLLILGIDLTSGVWAGHFGYILDAVGAFSSLCFAYLLFPSRLGLYVFGAFGSHVAAIVNSLIACMIHAQLHAVVLFGWSCSQNFFTSLALLELAFGKN